MKQIKIITTLIFPKAGMRKVPKETQHVRKNLEEFHSTPSAAQQCAKLSSISV
jgi:hypothetical protein